MKHVVPLICALVLAAPVHAEGAPENAEPGLSLMERGALMFMEGILREMEPAIDELSELGQQMGPALQRFADEMGPRLIELLDEVEDWSAYEAPEILPNGDIIIRRKPDPEASPTAPVEDAPSGAIDL